MTTYNDLKTEYTNKVNTLMTECGVFWAFSQAQFTEKEPKDLVDGDRIVSVGMGGYMPKSRVDEYLARSKQLEEEYKRTINQSEGIAEQAILYELNNYECFYTGDITDAMPTLHNLGYTLEQVQKVYKKHETPDFPF